MKEPLSGFKNGFMEKKMATHSSILAWKSPWTEEPGRLQSMGLHDWACVHECDGRWVGSNKLVELKKKKEWVQFPNLLISQFSRSVVSNSLPPSGLQYTRLPCPSPIPGTWSNLCPSSQWCLQPSHPLSSSSSCLQSFPASGSFPVSWLFASGGQSIGASVAASVLPMNIQDWVPSNWLVGSPCSPRDSQEFLQHHSSKASILWHSTFFMVPLSHPNMTTEKIIALTRRTFVSQVMSLLFNMLSTLVIAFLPRSKHLLISWLSSPSAVFLEPKKVKSVTVSIVSPSVCHEVMYVNCELPDVQARFRRGRGNYWYYI